MTSDSYLLGDSDREVARLAAQHEAWDEICRAGWRRAGFRRGQTLIDLGCGPGLATRELAHIVGQNGRVIALDPSERFQDRINELRETLPNIDPLKASAADTTLPADSVDSVYVRWVFCFLADPRAAVRELARVVRPGGRLLVLDYFNYTAFSLAPPSPVMRAITMAIGAYWERAHGTLEIQGNLAAILEDEGFEVSSINNVSPIARPGDPLWHWPEHFLQDYLPQMVEAGLLDQDTVDAFWTDWRSRESTPGSYLFLPPMLEIVARRRG